ncbi:MAG: DNA polymerase I [Flavobacteriales bacterium]|nr:DNA polymerase I [Flavobacteriales bacterium]
MPKDNKKLYLLDAMALIYRAYFAFIKRPLINSKGLNTSAMTGFINALWDLMQREQPSHLAVAFDTFAPTDRSTEYSFYKANRDETPKDIISNLEPIKEFLKAFHIPIIEMDGYEADDLIGTLAKQAEAEGYTVYMVTPDKDFGQLVSENILMYKPAIGGRPQETMGVQEVLQKWDIERIDQVIDMLGLMGDAVDNIPGIPGVGEKTAQKLLKEFDSIEGLLAHTDQLKGKLKEKVENGKENALVSKMLATIITDAPIRFDAKDFTIDEPDTERLAELFDEFEFRTLGKRILGEQYQFGTNAAAGEQMDLFASNGASTGPELSSNLKSLDDVEHRYHMVDDKKGRQELIEKLLQADLICFDTETTGVDPNLSELVGLSFAIEPGEAWYVPLSREREDCQAVLEEFRPVLESDTIAKTGHNLKYDILILKWYGVEVNGPIDDSMIAHYLVEPEKRHGMDYLSESYLGYKPISIETLIGKRGKNQKSMRDVPPEDVVDYAAEDADISLQLRSHFLPALKERGVEKLYTEIEAPLVKVLAEMEFEGVGLDVPFLENYSKELDTEALKSRDAIFEQAGVEFNLNSPKQLGEVLFEKMAIPYKGKKTKTGQFSTSEDVLSGLKHDHPIVNDILDYRELTKLKSTYVDALPRLINPKSGRIHTSLRQAIVPTGRLSSDNPNLQNIPIRTERGRKIRKAFVPPEGDYILMAADYSQVELRIIAALSKDENMIQAFLNGEDIHSATASKVFGVPLDEVTSELRRKAKAVNFGLAYGQGAFGLAQNLGIKRAEAKEIIDNYFEKYPGIKNYMDIAVESAREKGYSETLLGRKRNLPDINGRNAAVRAGAERNAINTPIQGSAADIIKVAMVDIQKELKAQKARSKMILQVHDELVFDVHRDELDHIRDMVVDKMSTAVELEVPLLVEAGVGENWLEAH